MSLTTRSHRAGSFNGVIVSSILIVIVLLLIEGILTRSVTSNGNDHDHMHPQNLQRIQRDRHGRAKRATMPPILFTAPDLERDGDYWMNIGQETLQMQLQKNVLNRNVARNVIMFLGDGMSIPTLAATRIYMGGEEKSLPFEKFPYAGLSKTYCANTQVADSACTATAYLGGVKANYATIGVTAAVAINDCRGENNTAYHVDSIAKWAQDYGMATGLITTTAVTHASPAGVYAHTSNRNFQNDQDLLNEGGDPDVCVDIATQLINGEVGKNLKVIMGGGRRDFLPTYKFDSDKEPGHRGDDKDLIQEWKDQHEKQHHKAVYAETKGEMMNITADTDYVLGLFDNLHLPYHLQANRAIKPSLAEMVSKALDVLEKDPKGYFLFVEGGRIDHAHHDCQAERALDETVEFGKAIDVARKRTKIENTLIVVTSDHSHTMSIAGYSSRGNDILGINDSQNADDDMPYATLNYANGPGHKVNMNSNGRKRLNTVDMQDETYAFPSAIPLESTTHGGDDVGVFASGPWAHLFTGVYEQNMIPHAMAYAACIGKGLTACESN